MTHQLPDLPYDYDALEPHMSSETLHLHHDKHHATYLEKLNGLLKDSELADESLTEIVRQGSGGIFNNGAQAWNHAFFWHCLSPSGGGDPSGELAAAIERDFGGPDQLREQFTNALTTLFGSGWVWLAKDRDGKLSVDSRSNAGNPIADGKVPLLTCDMWEHAYYMDYQNQKAKYVDAFWQLVNWDFVAKNLERDEPFEP
jgi:Fe-Mn family superoxide dismutase